MTIRAYLRAIGIVSALFVLGLVLISLWQAGSCGHEFTRHSVRVPSVSFCVPSTYGATTIVPSQILNEAKVGERWNIRFAHMENVISFTVQEQHFSKTGDSGVPTLPWDLMNTDASDEDIAAAIKDSFVDDNTEVIEWVHGDGTYYEIIREGTFLNSSYDYLILAIPAERNDIEYNATLLVVREQDTTPDFATLSKIARSLE